MKPIEVFTRNWGVEDDGLLIVSGLRGKASAEDWIKEYRETIRHYSAAMETPDGDGESGPRAEVIEQPADGGEERADRHI